MPTDTPPPLAIAGIALVVVAVVAGLVWLILRLRYARKVRSLGWTFVGDPSIVTVHGLNCPPFGLGGARTVDDLIQGATPGGLPFRSLRYDSDAIPKINVTYLPLPRALPEAHLSRPNKPRRGVTGLSVEVGGWLSVAPEGAWASEVGSRLAPSLDALAAFAPEVSASLDGEFLVLADLPRDPEKLRDALGAADAVVAAARALDGPAPLIPAELSVYRHPDWTYRSSDDGALNRVAYTTDGFNHEARDVVYAPTPAGILTALTHHWDTRETRMVPDGKGGMRSQTYTKHHTETLAEIGLTFPFGHLAINTGRGERVRFESEDFNRAFKVRSSDPRFAFDVLHPQMMEWLLRRGSRPFEVESGRLAFEVADTDPATLADCVDTASGFFGRVRRFTWDNLGLRTPPLPPALPS